ncbi:hypothetical protein G3R41_08770 [Modestobacter muralis]|uniref:Uncharacterized protein n=1 Tax=Modestobacter muralis TaxID=1608614 RepID=A0A6P0H5T4_9ACTN|nr:hypothetical protein [Modestobacter muralis]NEN51032.1 hypothetical protein [Modestobacter muralis]
MTDARFPERWLNDKRVVRLNDSAFRTFVTTLAWSVSNRTDGVIELDDLDLIHGADPAAAQALFAAGLWSPVPGDRPGDGHQGTSPSRVRIEVFAETQTSSHELEVLENVRRRDREKKARQRAKTPAPANPASTVSPGTPSPGTVPRDSTGQEGQEGRQALEGRGLQVVPDDPSIGWPPVQQPATEGACRRCGGSLPPGLVTLGRTEHVGACV